MEPIDQKLLKLLDQLEAELKKAGFWLEKHPVDVREHMAPESYLQFYFLPEERALILSGKIPAWSVVLFNAPYDFGHRPEASQILQTLNTYGDFLKSLES